LLKIKNGVKRKSQKKY